MDTLEEATVDHCARWHYENLELVDGFFEQLGALIKATPEDASHKWPPKSQSILLKCVEVNQIRARITLLEQWHNIARSEQAQASEVRL